MLGMQKKADCRSRYFFCLPNFEGDLEKVYSCSYNTVKIGDALCSTGISDANSAL